MEVPPTNGAASESVKDARTLYIEQLRAEAAGAYRASCLPCRAAGCSPQGGACAVC